MTKLLLLGGRILSSSTYELTHEKIIESGKRLFIEKGYERANLREICKGAGITTGAFYRHFKDKESLFSALVEPAIQGLREKYSIAEDKCFDYILEGSLEKVWNVSAEVLQEFINYMFDHFDCFKLLLQCSDGTKYVNFTDWMVEEEIKDTLKMYDILEEKGIEFNRISMKEIHMIVHSYYSCIFETVLHDYKREEALQCVNTLSTFFSEGWRKIIGL